MRDYKDIFLEVLSRHGDDPKWINADFKGIKIISNTKVGTVGQDFIEALCKNLDIKCEFPISKKGERLTQSPWDIKIGGITFELKTATEDTNGKYQFNHIRYHRNYEAVLCLGVSPNELYFGIWSKADITTGKAGKLVTMEKGANASYKLTKSPSQLHVINQFKDKIQDFSV